MLMVQLAQTLKSKLHQCRKAVLIPYLISSLCKMTGSNLTVVIFALALRTKAQNQLRGTATQLYLSP